VPVEGGSFLGRGSPLVIGADLNSCTKVVCRMVNKEIRHSDARICERGYRMIFQTLELQEVCV
jgi:hypothetical protein